MGLGFVLGFDRGERRRDWGGLNLRLLRLFLFAITVLFTICHDTSLSGRAAMILLPYGEVDMLDCVCDAQATDGLAGRRPDSRRASFRHAGGGRVR